ncbi:MAG: hypothetical protein CRU78_13775 [Candidatus Accumulibacter phosphatis]|uniref:OmpA-like domain-containing protein n=1 Tax=Candidatus Accumulibacter phosphatis TaxID=327160 RepID=A0A6A7RVE5_9PROT|nr:hypothetical protein [Candidatus Accumulibacter phosphatis]
MSFDRSSFRVFSVAALVAVASTWSTAPLAEPVKPAAAKDDVSFRAELVFWESVRDTQNASELQAYLSAYPTGRFSALARLRIKALDDQAKAGEGREAGGAMRTTAPASGAAGGKERATTATTTVDRLQAGDSFRDCELCPEMVVVPPGSFEMGSDRNRPEEKPSHRVTIPGAFAIGTHEITVAQWDACLKEGECRHSPEPGRDGRLPMANVSWNDVQDYLKWLRGKTGQDYRLPSEAEWEYAARAGSKSNYWWGNEKGAQRANCTDCDSPFDGKDASPAGSFAANAFGLYDVHGNVWEWTEDCWNPSYRGAPADGKPWLRGDCLSRVLRGGSWALDHEYMRSSRRSRYDRDVRYYVNGFRVVRPVEAPAATASGDPAFESAVTKAANTVFSNAPKSASGSQAFIVDPLIDGLSGAESAATRRMEAVIVEAVRGSHPSFTVEEFTPPNAATAQFAVVGTFTGVNKQRETSGTREAFRVCLVLLDLKAGKVAANAKEFARPAGVDITPTKFFQDSPVWIADPATQAYIRTCQTTKPGDPIDPVYLQQLKAAALISEAVDAYEKGQYEDARNLFASASQTAGGDQLRTYIGLYLSSWKLGAKEQTAAAIAKVVDFGLNSSRLAIKFPFKPGSTALQTGSKDAAPHELWLAEIARETTRRGVCLEITGHTHAVGPKALNQRLTVRRAEYIKQRLEGLAPDLARRTIAAGKGADENLVGSGSEDARDELDRRIEFAVFQCKATR